MCPHDVSILLHYNAIIQSTLSDIMHFKIFTPLKSHGTISVSNTLASIYIFYYFRKFKTAFLNEKFLLFFIYLYKNIDITDNLSKIQ